MRSKISTHAHDHIVNRVKIGLETLRTILDDETRSIVVHQERRRPRLKTSDGGFRRRGKKRIVVYKLFFSWKAGTWFVAIQDTKDGVVITVQYAWMRQHTSYITSGHLVQAVAANCRQIGYSRGGF